MNIFEIAQNLPNGFHDAELTSLSIDYIDRTATLNVALWLGALEDQAQRETYRSAVMRLSGVTYCVMDRPDPEYPFAASGSLRIDLADADPSMAIARAPEVPFRLWVAQWNGFIHLCATEADLEWLSPPEVRTPCAS